MDSTAPSASEVTRLLGAARQGDPGASDKLMALVYQEMRGMAGNIMRAGQPGHTLQPTALVHEAWMKLCGNLDRYEDRRHFLATAALAMRSILADHARAHRREKRGGGAGRVTLFEIADGAHEVDLLALHDCLERLASLKPLHAKIIELRALGSLTIDETAEQLGISRRTVSNHWRIARAWLWRELYGDE